MPLSLDRRKISKFSATILSNLRETRTLMRATKPISRDKLLNILADRKQTFRSRNCIKLIHFSFYYINVYLV